MSSISLENIESPEAVCSRRITELAYEYSNSQARVADNHYRTIRLLEACTGPFYGIGLFKILREEIMSSANTLRNQSQEPLKCAVIGEFSAGKSSLINALIGIQDFLPVNLGETTALVTQLEYSKFPVVQLVMKDGELKESSIDEYRRLVDQNCDATERDRVEKVTVKVDYAPLKYMTVIDTPGLNSKLAKHEAITLEHINKVQVVLWVFSAVKPVSRSELGYLEVIKSHGCKVYGIINMIDAVNGFHKRAERWQNEMNMVLEVFNEHCGSAMQRFIPLSAKEALHSMAENNSERLAKSNIQELKDVILMELADKAAVTAIKEEHLAKKVAHTAGLGKAVEQYLNDYKESCCEGLEGIRSLLAFSESQAKERFEAEYQEVMALERRNPTPWDHL